MSQHWIYHPQHQARIVGEQEYFKLLEEGWYDTPAKFPSVNTRQGLGAVEVKVPDAEEAAEEKVEIKETEEPKRKAGRPKKDA